MFAQPDTVLPVQIYLPSLSQAFGLAPFPNYYADVWCQFDFAFSYWILWLQV